MASVRMIAVTALKCQGHPAHHCQTYHKLPAGYAAELPLNCTGVHLQLWCSLCLIRAQGS